VRLSVLLTLALFAIPVAVADENLDAKYQSLQDAVTQKNHAEVKKLALELFPLVDTAICETAPESADDKPAWNSRIEHAKGIGKYAEYAIFAMALESQPAEMIDLVVTLEKANPKSQYLDRAYGPYFVALAQSGAEAKVPAIAEKALANFPENDDLLLVLSNTTVAKNQTDRALTYSNRLVASLLKHTKPPEGVPEAAFEKKRSSSLGRGYWISGAIYAAKGQWVNADKNLRAALPLIQGNNAMMGTALFQLGMANYNLGKMTASKAKIVEAAQFSQKAAVIEGPYAEQARHNALVMKAEADKMR
jgi:hypothetical protein